MEKDLSQRLIVVLKAEWTKGFEFYNDEERHRDALILSFKVEERSGVDNTPDPSQLLIFLILCQEAD